MRNLTYPTASRAARGILLAAASAGALIAFEFYLARLLDDHLAAVMIAMTASVIVVAVASTVFPDRRR